MSKGAAKVGNFSSTRVVQVAHFSLFRFEIGREWIWGTHAFKKTWDSYSSALSQSEKRGSIAWRSMTGNEPSTSSAGAAAQFSPFAAESIANCSEMRRVLFYSLFLVKCTSTRCGFPPYKKSRQFQRPTIYWHKCYRVW